MSQKILYPDLDAYVAEHFSNINFGNKPYLFTGQYLGPGDDYRSFIKFDLNQLVPPITISSAILSLWVYGDSITTLPNTLVEIYRLTQDFNQQAITWNNQPASSATLIASNTIVPGFTGWVTFDITTLVQGWVSGTFANSGIFVKGNELTNDVVKYRSRQYNDSAEWPILTINYVDGTNNIIPGFAESITPVSATANTTYSTPIRLQNNQYASFIIKNTHSSTDLSAQIVTRFFPSTTWIPSGTTLTIPTGTIRNLTSPISSATVDEVAIYLLSAGSGASSADIQPTVTQL